MQISEGLEQGLLALSMSQPHPSLGFTQGTFLRPHSSPPSVPSSLHLLPVPEPQLKGWEIRPSNLGRFPGGGGPPNPSVHWGELRLALRSLQDDLVCLQIWAGPLSSRSCDQTGLWSQLQAPGASTSARPLLPSPLHRTPSLGGVSGSLGL